MGELYHWFDLLGVAVFAISGTLLAHEKSMDGFGVIVLASVTAIGGGTLRDLILDMPVFWVHDTSYFITILVTVAATIVWLNIRQSFPHFLLQLADALGIAFFAIMGAQKALGAGVPVMTAVIMGVLTGCFGGMIRDVLAREVPMLLKGPLYAIACAIGAGLYAQLVSMEINQQLAMWIGGLTTLMVRLAAIRWQLSLHVFRYHN
ncbi:trimeric intracellular cation channel family protein [Pseudoalteromonas sp. CO325X]|uniref:trimeric intracellular cation channel family protein n=1 Tax=Pseudoalteromonas sp. CO325X TaxID=1777262 RepID=UPI0010235287|nr:trimeric intracellular cation channel family protein [Pseudoalteromonas sp. CO325X]RZF79022.1 trimeric intracellular cation channel family protein [Pseudoalteromonas sp. CO325X]